MFDGLFANPLHWVILIVVVLIVFGPGKLPGVGASLGKSLREFKKASQEDSPGPFHSTSATAQSAARPTAPIAAGSACPQCGHENEAGTRFCGSCGASLVRVADAVSEPSIPKVASSGPVHCSVCQTDNPAGNLFCAHCGKLIEHSVQPV
jgi:sec-independent protein translocase protein TatA